MFAPGCGCVFRAWFCTLIGIICVSEFSAPFYRLFMTGKAQQKPKSINAVDAQPLIGAIVKRRAKINSPYLMFLLTFKLCPKYCLNVTSNKIRLVT